MGERYHRAQILLEPEQHRQLRQIAEREGRSISDVARQLIANALEVAANLEAARALRRAQALERLSAIREAAHSRYGVYQGDLVAEARAEREETLDRARRPRP